MQFLLMPQYVKPTWGSNVYLSLEKINTYYGDGHVLHDVTLSVGKGEVVALLGLNGAGKTTTMRSIMGLTPARQGRVKFNDRDITRLKPYHVARHGIGYVPETRDVFSLLTTEENLTIRVGSDSEWTLESIYDLFPGLKEIRNRRGDKLSGGQQQMVAIARALMTGPGLLLLDEPTQGLAPVIVADIRRLLTYLKGTAISVLLVEQSVNVALDVADRVYIIRNGKIVLNEWTENLVDSVEDVQRCMGISVNS